MTDTPDIAPDITPDTLPPAPDLPQITLDAVRELVLRAHPQVVPELVQGASVEALLASVEPASKAYTSISARLEPAAIEPPTPVPAGTTPPVPIDLNQLPTAEKLRRGIHERQRQRR